MFDDLPWFIDPRDHEAVAEHLAWVQSCIDACAAPLDDEGYIDALVEETLTVSEYRTPEDEGFILGVVAQASAVMEMVRRGGQIQPERAKALVDDLNSAWARMLKVPRTASFAAGKASRKVEPPATVGAEPTMWAEVVQSEYTGEIEWNCNEAVNRDGAHQLAKVELSAAAFSIGTKLTITEPRG